MSVYTDWKASKTGRVIGDGQCGSAVRDYLTSCFPGVDTHNIFPATGNSGVRLWAGHPSQYATWVANNHSDINQLPSQGDIMIFDATPKPGFTNQTKNPQGHTGVCDSADSSGYNLTQQNSPHTGSPLNTTHYTWKFRPCLGWYTLTPQTINVRIKAAEWNVRTGPATSFPATGIVRGGEVHAVTIETNGWAHIVGSGYIASNSYDKV